MKDITHYIEIEKLTAPVNNLEAIVLLSTGKEEQALRYHFIDQVIINTNEEDTDKAKNIDFYIYTMQSMPLRQKLFLRLMMIMLMELHG